MFQSYFSKQGKNLPILSSSGELTTKRIGKPWSTMSATDLAHDDDNDDEDDFSKRKNM